MPDDITTSVRCPRWLRPCLSSLWGCGSPKNGLEDYLATIQSRLLDMGAAIATPVQTSSESKLERTRFDHGHVEKLERWVDELDQRLPPLKNFILPSGGLCSAHLHVARTVCRRAERAVIPLVQSGQVDPEVGVYLNRYAADASWKGHCEAGALTDADSPLLCLWGDWVGG